MSGFNQCSEQKEHDENHPIRCAKLTKHHVAGCFNRKQQLQKLATLNKLVHENLEIHKELSKAKLHLISDQVINDKECIQRERKIE